MANPTADWEKVGDKFYRKIQLYTAVFDQDLELENYIVTGCSYGGAIGMLDLSKLLSKLFLEAFEKLSLLQSASWEWEKWRSSWEDGGSEPRQGRECYFQRPEDDINRMASRPVRMG
jgi:hypothetical protein